jgi:hypothetical protein
MGFSNLVMAIFPIHIDIPHSNKFPLGYLLIHLKKMVR